MTKITYIVKAGDTLSAIAVRYSTTYQKIAKDNDIADPDLIHPGDTLSIYLPNPHFPWTPPTTPTELFSPVANTLYHSPMEIIGCTQTIQSTLRLRLISTNGLSLGERQILGQGDGFDFFHTYIRFIVTEPMTAILEVVQESNSEDASDLTKVPLTLLPGQRRIDMDSPRVGDTTFGRITVTGYSLTFEGHVDIRLDQRNGSQLGTDVAMGGGTEYGTFTKSLNVTVDHPTPLLIGTRELSAQDGSPIDWTRIPIRAYPANTSQPS